MRAVQMDTYGGIDVLEVRDVATPVPGPGRVVVDVRAAGINIGEAVIREGAMGEAFPLTFPSGQGWDCAGVVSAVGEGVEDVAVGDEVIGWSFESSSQAQQVSLPATQVVPKPEQMSWEVAGSLFVTASTAYAATHAVGAEAGETVVVSAAAGGVGSLVVQMLRDADVNVIGIASNANAELLSSWGATQVSHGEGLAQRLREAAPGGIDAFVDCFGDGYCDLAVELGVSEQRVNTIVDFEAAQRLGVRAEASAQAAAPETVSLVADRVAQGAWTIRITGTYPLEQVREAFTELARRRTNGKIVLIP